MDDILEMISNLTDWGTISTSAQGGTWKMTEIPVRIAGVEAETRTENFPNTSLQLYCYASAFVVLCVMYLFTDGLF
jgi:hypothetical protein